MPARVAPWRLHPAFVVRMAGFPFAGLARLREVSAAGSAAEALRAEQASSAAASDLLAVLRGIRWQELDADGARALGQATRALEANGALTPQHAEGLARLGERVPAGLVASVLAAQQQVAPKREAAARARDEDLQRARGVLVEIANDARFREAVYLSSPRAFANSIDGLARGGSGGNRMSKVRERERVATAYLQRFSAKNETNSFFGPTGAGRTSDEPGVRGAAGEVRRRKVYVAHWAADALAARIGSELPALRVVARHPSLVLEGSEARWLREEAAHDAEGSVARRYLRVVLQEPQRLVLELADGTRTAAAIAEEVAARTGEAVEDLRGAVDDMAAAGMLELGPFVPSGDMHPLVTLVAQIVSAPAGPDAPEDAREHWIGVLGDLGRSVAAYETEPDPARREIRTQLEQRFTELTGDAAERNAGRHYADRALVSEECDGGVTGFELGVPEETRDALALLLDAVSLPLLARRAATRAWFRATFGTARVRFVEVERQLLAALPQIEDMRVTTAPHQSVERVRAVIGDAMRVPDEAAIDPVRLREAIDPAHLVDGLFAYHSLDAMPFRDCGAHKLLVGEIHAIFWIQEFLYAHLPECDELARERRALLAELLGGRKGAEIVYQHTSKVDLRMPTALDYELVVSGAPAVTGERALPISSAFVELGDDGFVFTTEATGEIVPVAIGALPVAFQLLSPAYPAIWKEGGYFPAELLPAGVGAAATPRLSLGPIVARRRIFRVPAEEVARALALPIDLVAVARLREKYGLPAQVFSRPPGEPKPLFVDFDSVHLLELFGHALGEPAAGGGAQIAMSELLPGGEQLVLGAPDGMRTCELRMCLWRKFGG